MQSVVGCYGSQNGLRHKDLENDILASGECHSPTQSTEEGREKGWSGEAPEGEVPEGEALDVKEERGSLVCCMRNCLGSVARTPARVRETI